MFDRLRRLFTRRRGPRSGGAAWPSSSRPLEPESRYVVTVDEIRVVCRRPTGEQEALEWVDLDAVIVETNDSGPWGTDVLWLLVGRAGRGGCVVPQGATGESDLLAALQRLPAFDNDALIEVMTCVTNRRFLCWRRPPAATATPGA